MEEELKNRLETLSKETKISENQDEWKSLCLLYRKPEGEGWSASVHFYEHPIIFRGEFINRRLFFYIH